MAHGNDGGGSIRIPASCCGLFGLKPTRARNPLGPDFGECWGGFVAEHALTRSVRDSAALLDATAGPDLGDPYWAPPPERPFIEEVGADPGSLRIAFTTDAPSGVPIHEDCIKAVLESAKLCADLGHEVEEISLTLETDFEKLTEAFTVIVAAGTASILKMLQATRDQVEPMSWALYEMGSRLDAADYVLATETLHGVSRKISQHFVHRDVFMTPVLAEPPVRLGTFDAPPDNPLQPFDRSTRYLPFTPLCNVTGQPAMSVPLFWNEEGLPVGTHFMGRFGDEATLIRLASQLEEARPWAHRRPLVCA